MNVTVRNINQVWILDLEGKITIGQGDVVLRDSIESLLNQGRNNILLNMERVGYMDSSGVGELMNCFGTTQEAGGILKLLNLSAKIKDVLQITQLLSLFDYFTDEQKAVESFSMPSTP